MRLLRIFIKNFRSIEEITHSVEPTCQVFVGPNESGKTNILKAMSMLDPEKKVDKKNVRIPNKSENPIKEAYVDFLFTLSDEEIQDIKKDIIDRVIFDSENSNLKDFSNEVEKNLKDMGDFRLHVDILKENRTILLDNSSSISGFGKLKSGTNPQKIKDKHSAPIDISIDHAYELSRFGEQSVTTLFEDCNFSFLFTLVKTSIEKLLPKVIYWEYREPSILPAEVSMKQFEDNPESCIPLKIMFNIAGITEIKKQLEDLREQSETALENAIDSVARKTTTFFKNIWNDYSNIVFYLQLTDDRLRIRIQDEENRYSYEQRSDGFKRFVSFLLLLSGKARNKEIKNAIIILDEPELGIQISGQEYLTKELINISENNHVFYATHSIFMIGNRESLGQFKVEKNKEITTVVPITDSNYTENEVTLNALGHSVFKVLQKENIIFEGWSDKKAFSVSIDGSDSQFEAFGLIHSSGANSINCITKILELAKREYLVISDSDKPAKDSRQKFEDDNPNGNWYTYEDILNVGIHTLEDFIKHESYATAIEKVEMDYNLSKFDMDDFKKNDLKRIEYIKKWIEQSNKGSESINKIEKELKSRLYASIKKEDLEERYFQFRDELGKKIEKDGWLSNSNIT